MILKMDIEHWEWESIIDLKEDALNKFKYIAIEYIVLDLWFVKKLIFFTLSF